MPNYITDLVSYLPVFKLALAVLAVIALIVLIVVLARVAGLINRLHTTITKANMMIDETNKLVEGVNEELAPALKKVEPMIERAELTVDTINLELLRVDAILEDVEQVTDIAGKTATTVNTVTAAPTDLLNSLFDKLRGYLGEAGGSAKETARFVYPVAKKEEE